jgi:acetylornithine deacetylase/succinyl-diaminopimelate desuccinylase-like protein
VIVGRYTIIALLLALSPAGVRAAPSDVGLAAFRALYKELVEINTTQSVGDCTVAANAMAAHLRRAGIPDGDLHIVVPPGHPKRGNLVAILHGTGGGKPVLLLAHIDVVEAKREDWQRDPFKLIEENGYFYARGTADDKAMAAIFTDLMVRYRSDGFRGKRDIKLALTCGEETPDDYDGVRYLVEHERALIDADFAINENGSGILDKNRKPVAIAMQAGQKVQQHFQLEVTGPGGVSSGPPRDTPIYALSRALQRIAEYDFPLHISDSSKAYLDGMSKIETGETAELMRTMLRKPDDAAAAARIRVLDPRLNSMLRTTCVAVRVNAGEADSALPRRATAMLDCHIVPGEEVNEVERTLEKLIAEPQIKLTKVGDPGLPSPPPPISEKILGPARKVAGTMWPGVPLVPYQVNGADDGRFLTPAGIPTYGLSGLFREPGNDGSHGLNERILVKSLYDGRAFLYSVVKLYADQP